MARWMVLVGRPAGFGEEGLGFWLGLAALHPCAAAAALAVIYARRHRLYLYILLCTHVTE